MRAFLCFGGLHRLRHYMWRGVHTIKVRAWAEPALLVTQLAAVPAAWLAAQHACTPAGALPRSLSLRPTHSFSKAPLLERRDPCRGNREVNGTLFVGRVPKSCPVKEVKGKSWDQTEG